MTDESINRSIQNSELTTKKNNKWMNQQPNEIKDDYAKGWIQRMTEGMKGWIQRIGEGMKGWIKRMTEGMKGWIQRMTEGMKGWIYLDWVWRGKVFALRASASALNI